MRMTFEVSDNPYRIHLVTEGQKGFQHRVDISDLIDNRPPPGKYTVLSARMEEVKVTLDTRRN